MARGGSHRALNVLMVLAMLVSILAFAGPAAAAPASPNDVTKLKNFHTLTYTPGPLDENGDSVPGPWDGNEAPYWWFHKGATLVMDNVNTDGFGPGTVQFFLGSDTLLLEAQVQFPLTGAQFALTMPAVPDGVYDLWMKAWANGQAAPFTFNWGKDKVNNGAGGAIVMDSTPPTVVQPNALIAPNGPIDLLVGLPLDIQWDTHIGANQKISDAPVPGYLPSAGSLGDLKTEPIQLYWSSNWGQDWFRVSPELPFDFFGGNYWTHVYGPPCADLSSPACFVKLVVTDRAGNTAVDYSNAPFNTHVVDSSKPEVMEPMKPANDEKITGDDYLASVVAEDDQSGINEVTFSWSKNNDGLNWTPINFTRWPFDNSGPEPWMFAAGFDTTKIPDSKLYDSTTWIQVKADVINGAGANRSLTHNNIIVDNSAPIVSLEMPENGQYLRLDVAVKYTAKDINSGIADHYVEVSVDNGTTWTTLDQGTACGAAYCFTWDTLDPLYTEVDVMMRAWAVNNVGLASYSDPITVHVDNTNPAITPTTLLSPGASILNGQYEKYTIGQDIEIKWQKEDIADWALANPPLSLWLSWNGCDGPWHLIDDAVQNTGLYPWKVASQPTFQACMLLKVHDKAGNMSWAHSQFIFEINGSDMTPPVVTISIKAPNDYNVYEGKVTFKAKVTDKESLVDEVNFFCSLTPSDPNGWKWFSEDETDPWTDASHGSYSDKLNTKTQDCGQGQGAIPDGSKVWVKAIAKNGVGGTNVVTSDDDTALTFIYVDNSAPVVEVTVPPLNNVTFPPVSKTYEVAATASDPTLHSGIDRVTFYWTPDGDDPEEIGTVSGNISTYRYAWNTTTVDDGCGMVTATATNYSGLEADEAHTSHRLCIMNTAGIPLVRGWNLISLPLIPDNPDIDVVLAELVEDGTVIEVDTYSRPDNKWLTWVADGMAPCDLDVMVDGVGYWVKMAEADVLVIHGINLPVAGAGVPPTYQLYKNWNLIGFKSVFPRSVVDYLGPAYAAGAFQQMYYYQPVLGGSGYYMPVSLLGTLFPTRGYWLAVSEKGTINP